MHLQVIHLDTPPIHPDLIIGQLLARWPETIPVFNRHKMGCVGCPMADFMTLADAIHIYSLDETPFLKELVQAISLAATQNPPP